MCDLVRIKKVVKNSFMLTARLCSVLIMLLGCICVVNNSSAHVDSDSKIPSGIENKNTHITRFNTVFEKYLEEEFTPRLPGYALAVIIGGDVVFSKVSGVRRLGADSLIDFHTAFRIASVSKTFTPAVISTLTRPAVDFESLVSAYLPTLKLQKTAYLSELTVRHLLSHSTGLMPHAYTNLIQDGVAYRDVVKMLDRVPFVCKPGGCYSYQNVIYNLAGDIVEQVTGLSYSHVVSKNLFVRLGMEDSSLGLQAFLHNTNIAMPHKWNKRLRLWQPIKPKENYYQLAPAAGVNASLNDMTIWLKAQLGLAANVLSVKQLNEIQTPNIKTSRKKAHYMRKSWDGVTNPQYALGWRTFDFKHVNGFVHHGGWVEGARAEIVFNRGLNMGMVFLTNSEPAIASDIVPNFITHYLNTKL